MSQEPQLDTRHACLRTVLRTDGPILVLIGLLLIVIGMVSFFSSFGTFQPPRYFWCALIGIPILGVGMAMSQYGYFGAFVRYISGEAAPVAKDTFNYMAHGTKAGVKEVAAALGEGLSAGMNATRSQVIHCPRCSQANDADAKFCKNCGMALVT
jgi:hypothetical protein